MATKRSAAARPVGVVAAAAAIVTLMSGCASMQMQTAGGQAARDAAQPATPGMQMTPGMVMPDGSTMGAGAEGGMSDRPTATATLVCGAEIRGDVRQILKLGSLRAPTATWMASTYTCTYRLPFGPLVMAVHESANPTEARGYAAAARRELDHSQNLAGLTNIAFGTRSGLVTLVKDGDTLTVDATRLPRAFGADGQKRADLAYELASDVLGCWTGADG